MPFIYHRWATSEKFLSLHANQKYARLRDNTIARWYEIYKDFHNFHWYGFAYMVINTDMCSYFSHFVLSCYLAFVLSCLRAFLLSFYRAIVLSCYRAFVLSCYRAFLLSCYRAFVLSCYRAFVLSCLHAFVLLGAYS